MVDAPDESLPGQSPDWADLKATYRLFDTDEATFEAICEPHWKQTRNTKKGRYLLISDTTDLNYTSGVILSSKLDRLPKIRNGFMSSIVVETISKQCAESNSLATTG